MALKYEDIRGPFLEAVRADKKAQALWTAIQNGQATYETASLYAAQIGECLAKVLKEHAPLGGISEWDIEDLIPRSLGLDHEMVTEACRTVQQELNADASLGIQYQPPFFDRDRAYGLVDELRNNPEFVNIQDAFYDQLVNFSQNVVDESIRRNARVMSNAGVQSRVIRRAEFKACPWCKAVAGNYDYLDVKETGNDVWRRHENCRCTIDYITERNGAQYRERVNNYRTEGEAAEAAERAARSDRPKTTTIRRLTDEERHLTDEQKRELEAARQRLEAYYAAHPEQRAR